MGAYNNNAGLGRSFNDAIFTTNPTMGRTFVVAASTDANFSMIQQIVQADAEGNTKLFSTITLALAATTAARGDRIVISPNFNTAPTLTELGLAATNGVTMEVLGSKQGDAFVAQRAATTLPQTGASPIFTITAPVKILDIIGEVTTTIQTQSDSLALMMAPTVGGNLTQQSPGNTSLCALLQVTGDQTGGIFTVTGTVATAMQFNQSGAILAQAGPLYLPAGNLQLSASAGNTGAVKWIIRYQPIAPGAFIYPT